MAHIMAYYKHTIFFLCLSHSPLLLFPPSLPPSLAFSLYHTPFFFCYLSLTHSLSLSAVLTPLAYRGLRLIPIPVVLGVFFYLAYSSLSGVQLTKRIKLLFTPPKHHPDVYYIRKVCLLLLQTHTPYPFSLHLTLCHNTQNCTNEPLW